MRIENAEVALKLANIRYLLVRSDHHAGVARDDDLRDARSRFDAALARFSRLVDVDLKYDPDQPRVPSGQPGGGQWTSGGGAGFADHDLRADDDARGEGVVLSDATPDPVRPGARYAQAQTRDEDAEVILVGSKPGKGGIPAALLKWTVQELMSVYCRGSIKEVMPKDFLGDTIEEVEQLAAREDKKARICIKLLRQPRFRK